MRHAMLTPESSTGIVMMDIMHQQLDDALRVTLDAEDADFTRQFHNLVTMMEEVFSTEESWMEEIDYPAIKAHREQHARALSGMHHVDCSLMAGDVTTARKVVTILLPDWLRLHMATMDAALAMYLQLSGMPQIETTLPPVQYLRWPEFRQ